MKVFINNAPYGLAISVNNNEVVNSGFYNILTDEELKEERRKAIEYSVYTIWKDEGFVSALVTWDMKTHAAELIEAYEKSLEGE